MKRELGYLAGFPKPLSKIHHHHRYSCEWMQKWTIGNIYNTMIHYIFYFSALSLFTQLVWKWLQAAFNCNNMQHVNKKTEKEAILFTCVISLVSLEMALWCEQLVNVCKLLAFLLFMSIIIHKQYQYPLSWNCVHDCEYTYLCMNTFKFAQKNVFIYINKFSQSQDILGRG